MDSIIANIFTDWYTKITNVVNIKPKQNNVSLKSLHTLKKLVYLRGAVMWWFEDISLSSAVSHFQVY